MALLLTSGSGVALAAVIIGTPADDRLVGTTGADRIVGLAGGDQIYTKGGNDTVSGGSGLDTLVDGRPGPPTSSPGHLTMDGGPGDDRFWNLGSEERRPGDTATLRGGPGADFFVFAATQGNDVISRVPVTITH